MRKAQYYISFIGAFVFGFVALNIYNSTEVVTRFAPERNNNANIEKDSSYTYLSGGIVSHFLEQMDYKNEID